MHGEVDEEVGRASEGEGQVAEVGDVGDPFRPGHCLSTEILESNRKKIKK